ncbi:MAG TPA: hypothetical protein GXZ90_05220 [Clostridiales bacterium]|nr:hypothetical protein [Clostridiales bacterium]
MVRIKFGLDEFKIERDNWSKHHKEIGLHVKRVYNNGREILSENQENQEIKNLVDKYTSDLKHKVVILYDHESEKLIHATDYFLVLKNLNYPKTEIDYYSIGSGNTKQTTHIRITFQVETDLFILDHSYTSDGIYAASFYDYMDMDKIEDILDVTSKKSDTVDAYGITQSDDSDYYRIVLVSAEGQVNVADVHRRELLRSFIGMEVYKFDQKII